jgi:2,3,4,5-tetrahydropyridine-2-carboxylate N-succinyltransferase
VVKRKASAAGLSTVDANGRVLDSWYPKPVLAGVDGSAGTTILSPEEAATRLGGEVAALTGEDRIRGVHRVATHVTIDDLDSPIIDVEDAFLRLHLLSHRLVRPNSINLEGLLDVMPHGVAWTSLGPCCASDLGAVALRAQAACRSFLVRGIFPVPPMLDYVWPSGVTIADAMRVLLGAHLAPGTMVTPEGFCGVNAGTLGPCMVEGRISAGVVIGSGSDVGGGASLMGVISGGGRQVVSMGERSLLGANAGIGIALGNDCIVEAGCYITAGARVRLADGRVVKARELSGQSRLIFRRNALTGSLEALENTGRWRGLNPVLHPV